MINLFDWQACGAAALSSWSSVLLCPSLVLLYLRCDHIVMLMMTRVFIFEMCSDEKHFSRLMPGAGLVAAQIQSRFSIWENDAASYIWSFVDCGWAPFKRVFHVGKDTGILRYDKALCHHDITIMNIWNYDFDWYCLLCDKILPATANTVRCNLRGGIQRNYWTNPRHRCCHHRHCRRHHMVTSSPSSSSSLSWFESKSKSGPTLTAGVVVENHAITNKVKVSK